MKQDQKAHGFAGFSEEALRRLKEVEDHLPPAEAYARDYSRRVGGAGQQRPQEARPHYWGHRERLRQRFSSAGVNALPDYEILELILFNGITRIDVKPLAKELLATFGDLNGVLAAPEARLLAFEKMTPKAVIQLRLCAEVGVRMAHAKVMNRDVISSWADLINYCKTVMAHKAIEEFRILFLDRKNVLIADEPQARGTVDHVPVYTREVVKRALEVNASALILVHNHPSGDSTPSQADIDMTRKIEEGLRTVGIILHDHLIIGKGEETSFRSLGLI